MELSDLKRLFTAAREISVQVGSADAPRNITVRLPTHHELTIATLRSGVRGVTDDLAATALLSRMLLTSSVVAWSGVLVGDVLPDLPQAAEPLVCEPSAVELLFDAKPEWSETVWSALMESLAKRRAVQDTAEKNSAS
jgi:hypothetical protein